MTQQSAFFALPVRPAALPFGLMESMWVPPLSSTRTGLSLTAGIRQEQSAWQILNEQFGVYRCHTIFNCTDACPRDIQVTQAIGEVKKALAKGRID